MISYWLCPVMFVLLTKTNQCIQFSFLSYYLILIVKDRDLFSIPVSSPVADRQSKSNRELIWKPPRCSQMSKLVTVPFSIIFLSAITILLSIQPQGLLIAQGLMLVMDYFHLFYRQFGYTVHI